MTNVAKTNLEGLYGLASQDPEKRKLATGLLAPYLLGFKKGNLATAVYCTLREMNQGADCKPPIYGDEPLYSEPREYMTQLLTLVDGSGKVEAKFWDTRVHKLVEWILPRLRADSSLGDDGAKLY